ncbi:hypothetical protein F4859DRAFT_480704 [Xylaria cf. heliscus]|nr:hypothetical protein F4859DRAFT_480704 [Xylaria cf. heliscus]
MAVLLLPDEWDQFASNLFPERPQTAKSFVPFMMNQIDSVAVELAPPDRCPWIDNDLKTLVIACLASEPDNRPGILELHEFVRQAVNDRNNAYYQSLNDQENIRRQQVNLQPRDIYDVSLETEDYIKQIVHDLMLTPPTHNV